MEKEDLDSQFMKYLDIGNIYGEYSLDTDILKNLLRQAIDGGYFGGNSKKVETVHPNGLPINWDDEINT